MIRGAASSLSVPTPPPVVPRPKLALFLFLRDLRNGAGGEAIGVGAEQVRRYCLPFGDENRVVPPPKVMERIVAWTAGEVGPADFYPSAEPQP